MRFRSLQWTRTQFWVAGLTSFLAGLWMARYGWQTDWLLVVAAGLGLVLVVKRSRYAVLAVAVFAMTLGVWRGHMVWREITTIQQLYGQEVTMVGTVHDDPAFDDRRQLGFHVSDVRLETGQLRRDIRGRVFVRGFSGLQKIGRGDVVRVAGKFRPTLGNRVGQISFAELTLLGRKQSPVETTRNHFFAGIHTALPDPQGSLGLGFLVGLRTLLPETLLDQLGRTGLTHIVAVSGYNLTILVRLPRRLLMRYSKYIATASSAGLILGFIAVTGLSPSIFRAAVVSGLALTAWYYGRNVRPSILLLLSAAVTAGIAPTFLWWDIGWWLSFLAFFGVLVLAPAILTRFFHGSSHWLLQLLVETFSAQLLVIPIIAFIFGELSVISLAANMLVLPLIPLAMLLTFIAGVAGMVAPTAVGWLAWPALALLTLMVWIVEMLANVSMASINVQFTAAQMVFLYMLIAGFTITIRRFSTARLRPGYSIV